MSLKLQFTPYIFPTQSDYPELYQFPGPEQSERERMKREAVGYYAYQLQDQQRNYQQRLAEQQRDHQMRLQDIYRYRQMELLEIDLRK